MGIAMAGLSPHPPLIIPEIGQDERQKVSSTIESLKKLSEEFVESNPDLIIFITPHGPVFRDALSTLGHKVLKGDFADFGCPDVNFVEENDVEFISNLEKKAGNQGIEVVTLGSEQKYNLNFPTELDHGVLVPLYFLRKAGLDIPIVALTMGLLPYKQLYDMGLLIQKSLSEMNINGAILASGDLSHRLKPGAPAGFNPRGEEFDKKIVELIRKKKFDALLELDTSLIEKAGECGLRPIIIMLGALRGEKVEVDVKSYEGPFGVGYAVVGIYPEEE